MQTNAAVVVALFAAHLLPGQCTHVWVPGQGLVGADHAIRAATMWDPDGPGPAMERLVVGGAADVVGEALANGIATRDPRTATSNGLALTAGVF